MEWTRYRACLDADLARLRAVAPAGLSEPVPTCPGWTGADLTRHVGAVYLHKTVAMREGVEPEQWPPAGLDEEDPLVLLERASAALRVEFDTRNPEDPAGSWYAPDQTVGFWIRRMAHETVIHRIDAELAAGQPIAPVPDDLARDGIDEVLRVFLAYSVEEWGDYFREILDASPGWAVAVQADGRSWLVRGGATGVTVDEGEADAPDATVSGRPEAVLRWLWNRDAGQDEVVVDGSSDALGVLRRCLVVATQ